MPEVVLASYRWLVTGTVMESQMLEFTDRRVQRTNGS